MIPKLLHKMVVNMRKVHMRKHLILQVVVKTGANVRVCTGGRPAQSTDER